jgi:hypothetical protein
MPMMKTSIPPSLSRDPPKLLSECRTGSASRQCEKAELPRAEIRAGIRELLVVFPAYRISVWKSGDPRRR